MATSPFASMDGAIYPGILQGGTKSSLWLDSFVIMHSVCALSFASAMLICPSIFDWFTVTDHFPAYAEDSIRWASPFVCGFGFLAALSLTMPAVERRRIACLFAVSLGMAVPVGISVQMTGRYNRSHMLNIALFGGLSIAYALFLVIKPEAFDRAG